MKRIILVLVVLTASTFLSSCGTTCCNTGYSSCCGGNAVGNWY